MSTAWAQLESSDSYRRAVAHLRTHRDDEATWAVLSDLLLDGGHPRGELIALDRQLAQTNGAERTRLEVARRDVLQRHRDVLLGPHALLGDLALTWRNGFIDRADVPAEHVHPDCVRLLSEHPSGALLDTLSTGVMHLEALDGALPARHLVLHPSGGVDEVHLSDQGPVPAEAEVDGPAAARLWHFSRRFPSLERLTVHGLDLALVDISAKLHTLELENAGWRGSRLAGLSQWLSTGGSLFQLTVRLPHQWAWAEGEAPGFERLRLEGPLSAQQLRLVAAWAAQGLPQLDLEAASIDRETVQQLAGALQGSMKNTRVRLPSSLRKHERLRAILGDRHFTSNGRPKRT